VVTRGCWRCMRLVLLHVQRYPVKWYFGSARAGIEYVRHIQKWKRGDVNVKLSATGFLCTGAGTATIMDPQCPASA
jgi:hypothetical protein